MLKNSDIAKALGVTPQRVIALKKRGMPEGPDIETILRWREERLKANTATMAPKIEPADPMQIAAGTLEERIERHKLRVDEAERVWQSSMLNGDPNSSRFQSAYNASLKTMIQLENEAFDRKVKGGDFIRRSDAEEAMLSLCNLVVSLAERMPMELADQVNPDASAKAAKVLEAWVISFRKTAAEGACTLGREEETASNG